MGETRNKNKTKTHLYPREFQIETHFWIFWSTNHAAEATKKTQREKNDTHTHNKPKIDTMKICMDVV